MRGLRHTLLALALGLTGSAQANAVETAYVYTAEVTGVSNFGLPLDVEVGDTIEGQFRWDTEVPAGNRVRPAATRLTAELGTDFYSFNQRSGFSFATLVQDESFDALGFQLADDDPRNAANGLARLNGTPVASMFAVDFIDDDGSTLTSDEFPAVIPPFESWDRVGLFLVLARSLSVQAGLQATITSFVLVPEPGTAPLLACGLLALARRARGRA